MERLISRTTVSPRIHVPGRSPSLPARRTASYAGGGSASAAPWTAVRAQPPRPRRPWTRWRRRREESVLHGSCSDACSPRASTAAIFLLMMLVTSAFHSSIPHPAYASAQPAIKSGGFLSLELLSSGWAGFFAGCLHTLSGPDHLVALAPLSIGRSRLESGLVGALWGCGHDAGQIIFGLLFLLLKDRLHIEVLRIWGTRVVGLTLLLIGATGIREASEIQETGLLLEGVDSNMIGGEPLQQGPLLPPGRRKLVSRHLPQELFMVSSQMLC